MSDVSGAKIRLFISYKTRKTYVPGKVKISRDKYECDRE